MTTDLVEYLNRGLTAPQAIDYHLVVDKELPPSFVAEARPNVSTTRSVEESVKRAEEILEPAPALPAGGDP